MIWLALAAALATWALTGGYIRLMDARGRLDVPNARSMHRKPKPTGAGIVAIPIVLAAWWLAGSDMFGLRGVVTVCALALCALGWRDDMHGLPVPVRFGAQIAAIAIYLALVPADMRILPMLPIVIERALLALAWTWYVNLFNFMDGIDGIAGSEAATLGAGFLIVAGLAAPGSALAAPILAVTLGFLVWNWEPGRVMMGDAGSIPLGYLTGLLMLELAFAGHVAAACILPLFFGADATITLARRLAAGKKPHEAHREHFYQRAALGCGSHATVVKGMIVANLGLVLSAVVASNYAALGIAAASLTMLLFFMWLARTANQKAPA